MLFTVVLHTISFAGDGDSDLVGYCRDAQLAGLGLDVVVLIKSAVVQRIGKLVIYAADIGYCAGYGVSCAFAIDEAVAAYGYIAVGQRCAVVDLRISCGGQSYIALSNSQRAVNRIADVVVAGHVFFAAHDLYRLYNVCAAACVGLAALDLYYEFIALGKCSGG